MESKEDLRVIKTRKAIKQTFLEMRAEMPLEKIHIRELCKRALINKSTFYNHYEDVYALSEELENDAIAQFLERFPARDCLFSDPVRFVSEMPEAFDANMELLHPLFNDRLDVAFNKLEQQLKRQYTTSGMTTQETVRLTFLLNGTLHTLKELNFGQGCDRQTFESAIAALIRQAAGGQPAFVLC